MSGDNKYCTIQDLPGPMGYPMVGNLLQIDFSKFHLVMEEWADQYGDLFRFKLANKTVLATSNTEFIQKILHDRPKTFRRINAIETIARELQVNGIFTSEGDHWRRQRFITSQAFKLDCLRRFFPKMQQITDRLYKRWDNYASSGQKVDVDNEWMLFTVDITTNFAFGYDINLLKKENDSFHDHLKKQFVMFYGRINAPFPYWHYIKLPRDRDMERSLRIIKETINSFISSTRRNLSNETENKNLPANFLEALILSRDQDGSGFSDEEIQGNIYNILLAGEDTTAHTLSWLLIFITQFPDVQRKMQEEVDSILGEERLPASVEVLDKLTYIEAVAYETLRLKGTAPLIFLESNIETEINNLKILKSTPIMLITRHCALQDKNFSNACEFKPERWINERLEGINHNNNAFLQFGSGPRSCPGRILSIMEMKIALAMVCKNFTVSRVDTEQPIKEVFSFTMMPDTLKVRFEKRKTH